jgi:acyl carrier protein
MKKAELLALLTQALELAPATLQETAELSALDGWDSMSPLVVMSLADKRFGLMLSASDIQGCKTVADVLGLFDSHLQG